MAEFYFILTPTTTRADSYSICRISL